MSERYTPHDFRKASLAVFAAVEEAVAKELAAMLHQAATDAEALEALRARYSNLAEEQVDAEAAIERTEKAEAALTAERQKIRELREWLVEREATKRVKGRGADDAASAIAYEAALDHMAELALTGDATEGQG